ncbi:DapH/DapD/GlmU-related protein [Vibrio cyclitrophicus]
MFKKIIKWFYLNFKFRKNSLRLKTLNIPASARIGFSNTIETGVSIDGDFEIGDLSYINKNSTLSDVSIGKYSSISSNCSIGGFEHPIHHFTTHPIIFNSYYGSKRIISVPKKKTIIGNDVWVGHGAIIKQGVIISDGAVVAAGAVVTKNIPPYEIWAGVPAKKINVRSVDKYPYGKNNWWDIEIERIREWKEY